MKKRSHRNKLITKTNLPGHILSLLQLIAVITVLLFLHQTKLIPDTFLLILGAILLVVTLIVYFLSRDIERKRWFVLGTVLFALTLAVFGLGASYLHKGINTLNEITESSVELADIGVYVKQQDQAASIEDMSDTAFGILAELDRENTDKALEELGTLMNCELNIVEYAGIPELMSGLLVTGEVEAVIMNSAFLDMISEMEGYETIAKQLREICTLQIESIVETEEASDEEPDGQESEETVADDECVLTLYISGIDSKKGLVAKSRSDVNIIVVANTKTRQLLLVSTPRDYYIPLSISNGVPDKLTHAGIYGINVSQETLEMLYGIEIDYYFRVNFSGFENIIDALGGITVMSDYEFVPVDLEGKTFYKGENYLNGEEALAFARERHAFSSGDRQRGENQMAVIEGVVNKALSPALLKNFSGIMESLTGSFETNVPYDVIAELVRMQLRDSGEWNIVSYSVDGSGASKKPYSMGINAYVMLPNYETVKTAIRMMEQVKEGKIPEQT